MKLARFNGWATPFRSLLPDFFDVEDLTFDHLLKRNGVPSVNISETDNSYEIELAAPGLHKKDFNIQVENGLLTVSAESEKENEEKKKNYTRQEYSYSSFSRSFSLPANAKEEDIKAEYDGGVLKLTLAKKTATVPKAKTVTIA